MKFRTEVDIAHSSCEIDWNDSIQLYGSCFVESIGQKLSDHKLTTDCNPFGVLYNPHSIIQSINWLQRGERLDESDIIEHQGVFHSLLHHSSFSSHSKEQLLRQVEKRANQSRQFLAQTNWLIVTFGTAYLYCLKKTNRVVSNCHKLPGSLFDRERLTVDQIVDQWDQFIQTDPNQSRNILFTVSPIRHWKDGAHENQLSKSILLLSIDQLCRRYNHCHYFPSYELMMDELRDYRFYETDMNHPTAQAVEYIWERFLDTYFSQKSRTVIDEWSKLLKSVIHRPIIAKGYAYSRFNDQTLLKLAAFKEKYPYFDIENEVSLIEKRSK